MDERSEKADWRRLLAGGFAFMSAPFAVHPLDEQRARKMVFAAKREGASLAEIKAEAEAYLRKNSWRPEDIAEEAKRVEAFVKSIEPVRRKKSAWVITWEYPSGYQPSLRERLIDVRDGRTSAERIREFVERHHVASLYSAEEKMHYASNPKDNPYPAVFVKLKGGVPWTAVIVCGHNPFIQAKYVHNLKVYEDDEEIRIEYDSPKRPSL